MSAFTDLLFTGYRREVLGFLLLKPYSANIQRLVDAAQPYIKDAELSALFPSHK